MTFDLRLPLGLLLTLFGIILTGTGLFSRREIYQASLGLNVNLGWGLVLLVFGVVMLGLALRARQAER